MIDTRKRTVIKSMTWRFFAFVVLSMIAYVITGSAVQASFVAVAYHVIQFAMYFLHERMWNKISFGKTKGLFIQMTGMSGAGKTTVAMVVAKRLRNKGVKVEVIDGDEYREGLCKDLGFSKEDRNTNIRRLSFVGSVLARNNVVVLMSAINPYDEIRKEIKEKYDSKLVYVECLTDALIDRDTKGLYRKALLPKDHPEHIPNFTGISDPFEVPTNSDLVINTANETKEESVNLLERFILKSIGD